MNTLEKYLLFFKAHERFLLALLAAALLFGLTSRILTTWDKHDAARTAKDQAQVQTDKQTNAQLDADRLAYEADFNQRIAALNAEIKALNAATQAKIAADKTAPAPVVAKDLGGQAVDNTIVLPLDTARGLLAEIDTIPPLQTKLADTQAALTEAQGVIKSNDTLIVGLKTQISDQTKACDAQVAQLKVEKKKAWMSGFKWGFGTGFGLSIVLRKVL